MAKRKLDDLERVQIESLIEWRDWLIANHAQSESIWLVTFKKHCGARYVSYDDYVDEAMCWGWVDSAVRAVDKDRSMHLLSPRRKGSAWSAVNKDRVARMEVAGRMQPAGRALIDAAKLDGSWDFLNDVEALIEPDDLKAALDANPNARSHWNEFSRSSKRGILEWIKTAKRSETREKRIAETARLASQNIKANH